MERSLLKGEQAELSQTICCHGPALPACAAALAAAAVLLSASPERSRAWKQEQAPQKELPLALCLAKTSLGFKDARLELSMPPTCSRAPLPAVPPAARTALAEDGASNQSSEQQCALSKPASPNPSGGHFINKGLAPAERVSHAARGGDLQGAEAQSPPAEGISGREKLNRLLKPKGQLGTIWAPQSRK